MHSVGFARNVSPEELRKVDPHSVFRPRASSLPMKSRATQPRTKFFETFSSITVTIAPGRSCPMISEWRFALARTISPFSPTLTRILRCRVCSWSAPSKCEDEVGAGSASGSGVTGDAASLVSLLHPTPSKGSLLLELRFKYREFRRLLMGSATGGASTIGSGVDIFCVWDV